MRKLLIVLYLIASGLLYVMLCVAVLYEPAFASVNAATPPWAMRLLAPPVTSVIGPSMWFVWGRESWPVVVAAAASSCACLALAWRWRERGAEFLALTIAAATLIWVGSAWLALAMGV
jgi:hypothetical protein